MGNFSAYASRSAVILLIAAWSGASAAAQPAVGQPAIDTARKALDLLLASRYSEFGGVLTPGAREKLTDEFLRDRVGAEIAGFGTLQEVGKARTLSVGNERYC